MNPSWPRVTPCLPKSTPVFQASNISSHCHVLCSDFQTYRLGNHQPRQQFWTQPRSWHSPWHPSPLLPIPKYSIKFCLILYCPILVPLQYSLFLVPSILLHCFSETIIMASTSLEPTFQYKYSGKTELQNLLRKLLNYETVPGKLPEYTCTYMWVIVGLLKPKDEAGCLRRKRLLVHIHQFKNYCWRNIYIFFKQSMLKLLSKTTISKQNTGISIVKLLNLLFLSQTLNFSTWSQSTTISEIYQWFQICFNTRLMPD